MSKSAGRSHKCRTLRRNAVTKLTRFLKNLIGNIQEELEVAVDKGNLEKVRDLLALGADPRFRFGLHVTTYLHRARRPEVVRELLDHGAEVNAKDDYGCTPLYCAVSKELPEVVRCLLENGAFVNEPDEVGVTPLCLALNEHPKLELIGELLSHGADVCRLDAIQFLDCYFTRSCAAIKAAQLPVAKLVLKYLLLQHSYDGVVDLDAYSKCKNFDELVSHRDQCAEEVVRLKAHPVNKDFSIHAYVLGSYWYVKPSADRAPTEEEIVASYPIYHDVVLPKLRTCLERGRLFAQFTDQRIFAYSRGTEVTLTSDCLNLIAQYLSNTDMANFLSALEEASGTVKDAICCDKIKNTAQQVRVFQARCNIF